jgi:hypothetical protein
MNIPNDKEPTMLIFLRDTDLDGQPIIGSGLLIQGETAMEIVQKMQATSPFNAGDTAAYMRRVLDAAGDEEPLPDAGGEEAARAFLERLARQGLVEFMKEEAAESPPPADLDKALTAIRDSGLTNMLDHPVVARLGRELGHVKVADWIEAHPTDYTRYLLSGGFRPLGENFTDKGDAPCADKQD